MTGELREAIVKLLRAADRAEIVLNSADAETLLLTPSGVTFFLGEMSDSASELDQATAAVQRLVDLDDYAEYEAARVRAEVDRQCAEIYNMFAPMFGRPRSQQKGAE
jgi:hypothetical protein